ncbi:MAG: DEAD/DEAH box helicase, partial [Kiritimatiellae bacterium]|nr:DEAD/DEAH box helicase [Kiritimatiellia bacterium]
RARWLAIPANSTRLRTFYSWLADAFIRRAGRTALEGEDEAYPTFDDAYLAALRNDTGTIKSQDAPRDLPSRLAAWREGLMVSPAERARLEFRLVPPPEHTGEWLVAVESTPSTRAGVIALAQAREFFEPLASLKSSGRESPALAVSISHAQAESFISGAAANLRSAGYSVSIPDDLAIEQIEADIDVSDAGNGAETSRTASKNPALNTSITIRVAGEKVSEEEIRFLLDQGSSLVFFRNRWIEVDRAILKEALRAIRQVKGEKMSVREAVGFSLGLSRRGNLKIRNLRAHGWLRGLLNELSGEEQFALVPPPAALCGTLRDYQLRGASWLAFLSKWGFGPLLADDMGLGKTIQTIAFLLHNGKFPALVVAPVTLTANWQRELARFAPSLKVHLYQGSLRKHELAGIDGVTVTSYSLLVKDFHLLSHVDWQVAVFDEAQTLKNDATRVHKAAAALRAASKIALTGTPLENSALDIWCIEDILNPGLLGERAGFARTFSRTDAPLKKLRRAVAPFLLRRLKTDPAISAELGEKREIREYTPLSATQRTLYEAALQRYREDSDYADARSRRGRALALLTELKEICDCPELAGMSPDFRSQNIPITGGKVARLEELLAQIFAAGESALVFTQYARMGALLQTHLMETIGVEYPFLHGSLSPKKREEQIEKFNASEAPCCFILSLKAGGFGLNLTRATHVIHFDRWWNPAVESQATDRAHRIGQTRNVFSHLFIAPGTVEDRVDALLEQKKLLAGSVITNGEAFLAGMNPDEFARIVSLD